MFEDALDRLTHGDAAGAIVLLVKEWQKTPIGRLADLIDTIDARVPKAAIDAKAHKAWIARAKAGRPADLSALLATLGAGTIGEMRDRIRALDKFGRDPRIASTLFRYVREVPFTSNGSRPTWLAIFEKLGELDDPRVASGMASAKQGWGIRENQRAWLEPRVDALVATLSERLAKATTTADDATGKALATLEEALGASAVKVKVSGGTRTLDDLLADIYRDPQDDRLRAVYGDALQELDDPRGEFIALQLQTERTKEGSKREKALLKKYEREWLGPLEPAVSKKDTEFARGFLVGCHVHFKNERDVRAYGSLPAWATVERMRHGLPGAPPLDQMRWLAWIDPAMKSLRDVDVYSASLRALCASPHPWLIEHLRWDSWHAREKDPEGLQLLATTDRLPKLTSLALRAVPTGIWLSGARFAPRVRELSFEDPFDGDDYAVNIASLVAAAKTLPALERISLTIHWKYQLELTRDPSSRRFSVAKALVHPARLWDLSSALERLPVGTLTELTAIPHPDDVKSEVARDRLPPVREAAAAHKLARLDLSALE